MSLFLLIQSSLFFFFGTEREDILEKEKEDFSHTIWLLCGIEALGGHRKWLIGKRGILSCSFPPILHVEAHNILDNFPDSK